MNFDESGMKRPRIAILDGNTLAVVGLRQILLQVMPMMEIDAYNSFEEFDNAHKEQYFHYFVSMDIVLAHRLFFLSNVRKTIVLTIAQESVAQLSGFRCLCVSRGEQQLVRAILEMEQHAHAHGKNLPMPVAHPMTGVLSDREIEVLTLIVRGFLNKEIADKLHIGLTTVITHRKNIMKKLGAKSVSSLTIYAVMQGSVAIDEI